MSRSASRIGFALVHNRTIFAIGILFGALVTTLTLSALTLRAQPLTKTDTGLTLRADGALITQAGARIGQVLSNGSGQSITTHIVTSTDGTCDQSAQFVVNLPSSVPINSVSSSVSSLVPNPKVSIATSGSAATITAAQCFTEESATRATLTFPADTFSLPLSLRITEWIATIPIAISIIGLIIFVLGSFAVASAFTRLKIPIPAALRTVPPTNVSPIEFGLLLHGSIRSYDIVASIYELVRREHIRIIQQGSDTLIFRNREVESTDPLTLDEEILLTLLCPPSVSRASLSHALARLDVELFSKFIATLYSQVYNRLQEKGWITESVSTVRTRRKLVAVILDLSAILIAIIATFHPLSTLAIPLYGLALSLFVSGLFLYTGAANSRSFSEAGLVTLGEVISFSQFLKVPEPFPAAANQSDILFSYYGYALADKTTANWVARFDNLTIVTPLWISSTENYFNGPAEFFSLVQGLLSSLGARFGRIKDPNAD